MPEAFMIFKDELSHKPKGTSDWLYGYRPADLFLIYTRPRSARVDDYPHFTIPLEEGFSTVSGQFKFIMDEYHYSLADQDRRHRYFHNGLWNSPNPWERNPKNAEAWEYCKRFETMLQRVINP